MRIMVRAENPGGRGRFINVLQNQSLIDRGQLVHGLRVDEIGPIMIVQTVLGPGGFDDIIAPAVMDDAYHANLWIVQPLLKQLKDAFTGTPSGDEDEDNDLFQKIREAGTHQVASVINAIKRPEGYLTANNVLFYLPRWVATHRRVWA